VGGERELCCLVGYHCEDRGLGEKGMVKLQRDVDRERCEGKEVVKCRGMEALALSCGVRQRRKLFRGKTGTI
jgi:hypothetical protein